MKIYTKSGDDGMTSLLGGKRLKKYDIQIEAYGTVDELNSHIGLFIGMIQDFDDVSLLTSIQNRLFDIGSILAKDPNKDIPLPVIDEDDILLLENAIDTMEQVLQPLRNFILPGGTMAVSQAHVCRTVCRRSERRVISLERDDIAILVKYLNRLSDYLFVKARHIAHIQGCKEVVWSPKKK
ncbi:MAG: cob(I)yrinic acid a,c-diamide adenosyltransferase [Saprospiraceae bacterium]